MTKRIKPKRKVNESSFSDTLSENEILDQSSSSYHPAKRVRSDQRHVETAANAEEFVPAEGEEAKEI